MDVINQATAGDHQGLIKFKNWKKGLYIEESRLFSKKQTYINKETVESYEVLKDDSETAQKSGLAKGILGAATFGLAGAIAGSTSKKTKTSHKYLVSIIFKDGTRALCDMDDQTYEALLKLMY